MLTELTALLEGASHGLTLAEISRALHAQPGAVQGMIDLLVRRGRLVEVGEDGKLCAECGLRGECNLLAARGVRYAMVRRDAAASQPQGNVAEPLTPSR